jgi:phosphate transport system ATP-binding protein
MEAVNEQKNVARGIDVQSMQRGPRVNFQDETTCLEVKDFNLYYGDKQALHGINMQIPKNRVTAFIGPSGCGKSTLLRSFNRMNDLIDSVRMEGHLLLDGEEINSPSVNVADLRRQVGMVFQKPNPFPKSIYENVAYGLRLQGVNDRSTLDKVVEKSLKAPPFGMRSKIACTSLRWACPVVSSNVW